MNKIDVLDKGYVRLRDVMGDDLSVVNAARVSFDKRSDELSPKDRRLLNYLAREGHWSPFSHPHVMLEIKAPVMVVNQWYKHRIGSRFTEAGIGDETFDDPWNEMSGRYVSEELEFYVPDVWRSAPPNRKQGSGDNLDPRMSDYWSQRYRELLMESLDAYQEALFDGMAPEQARLIPPYAAMYTKLFWTPSLYTVLRFLQLREDEHAQWEIRQYAEAVRQLVQPLFPESFAAFEEAEGRGAVES